MGIPGSPDLREPWYRHLATVALLFAVAALRWRGVNELPYLLIDEASYFRSFQAVLDGHSPYIEPRYLYPPPLAVIGSKLLALWGQEALVLVLRYLNLMGGCVAVWASTIWIRRSWPLRLVTSALVVALAPPFATGVARGNLSLLAIGLALAALALWQQRPFWAGLALGLSLVLKPLAALMLPILLLHRSSEAGHRHRLAALTAAATAALLSCIGWRYLAEMGPRLAADPEATRVTSLLQLLHWFGLDLPVWLLLAAVAGVSFGLVLLRKRHQAELTGLCVTASLLSLPLVWNHTMLLALPLQCMAFVVALDRQGRNQPDGLPRPWQELALVGAAVGAIFLSNGFGAIEGLRPWQHGLLIAVPTLSPLALALYLARRGYPASAIRHQGLISPLPASDRS